MTYLRRAHLRSVLRDDRFTGLFAPRTLYRLSVDVRIVDGHYSVCGRFFGGESRTMQDGKRFLLKMTTEASKSRGDTVLIRPGRLNIEYKRSAGPAGP